ncbi:MAG: hypothetical protein DME98_05170 [Verrucomicrobia bacterium]|nr:MAG: hypothetical protein DME98_05170 [Verrucomicrobiota bacterium]PYJ34514.1 MAG: hypothetical protein DME88_04975 [Verrucomicrobiota bacterium]
MIASLPPQIAEAVLAHFLRYFLLCSAMAFFNGGLLFVILRRRALWLRYTAAEAAFWHRLRFPPRRFMDACRRFEEGRVLMYVLWVLVAGFCALMVLNATLYFYWQHRFHSM